MLPTWRVLSHPPPPSGTFTEEIFFADLSSVNLYQIGRRNRDAWTLRRLQVRVASTPLLLTRLQPQQAALTLKLHVMAIAPTSNMSDDKLNTVAVVPFGIAPTSSRQAASALRSANALAAAASNLINAIAQGSTSPNTTTVAHQGELSDGESDKGSSSFTYTAPSTEATTAEQQGWYASTPYHISNRYYDVDIHLKATKAALSTPTQPLSESWRGVLSDTFPAYLIVVDRTAPLHHHRQLASSLESKVATGFDAEISIVAGVSLVSSSNLQVVTVLDDDPKSTSSRQTTSEGIRAETSDLVALYADFGWEFIAIDELDREDDKEQDFGSEDGERYSDGEGDDADGIERIREALMNHMWNGLVRKDQGSTSASRYLANEDDAPDRVEMFVQQGFSNSLQQGKGDEEDTRPYADLAENQEPTSSNTLEANLSSLDLDHQAEASDLDEQLAKLFLNSTNSKGDDLDALEAFLESQDPSWPQEPKHSRNPSNNLQSAQVGEKFEDDFADFLSFQSFSCQPIDDQVELPSEEEISSMQNRLFGSNATATLEAGPLGMGNASAAGQDLSSQLQQLQWHAERVRNIQDPDQRRKEAALIALAFSMQWGNEGSMTF